MTLRGESWRRGGLISRPTQFESAPRYTVRAGRMVSPPLAGVRIILFSGRGLE